MKIVETGFYDKKFYNEFLYILSKYRKILKRPNKKIKGVKFEAIALGIVSVIVLVIFLILNFINSNKSYQMVIYIYLFITLMSILYYFVLQSKLKKLSELKNNVEYSFNKDDIKCKFEDETYEAKWKDIKYILVNKYSICFVPINISFPLIGLDIKYLDKTKDIVKKYKLEDKLVDNTEMYKKRGE